MKEIQDIIQSLNATELSNGEILYDFSEFCKVLKEIHDENIEIHDCIITPHYVYKGRRLELYEFELNIRLVDEPDFEKYLLNKTGKSKVEDISREVVLLQRNCYFELPKTTCKLPKKKIQQYIDYLYNNDNLKKQVQQVFGKFDKEKLLFEFY